MAVVVAADATRLLQAGPQQSVAHNLSVRHSVARTFTVTHAVEGTVMTKLLALAFSFALVAATAAEAQQNDKAGGTSFTTTPGVTSGTNGTTFGAPGGAPMSPIPGGSIPMAAGTQDSSTAPSALPNYNNSLSSGTPRTGH
jgi:hypothetical protein